VAVCAFLADATAAGPSIWLRLWAALGFLLGGAVIACGGSQLVVISAQAVLVLQLSGSARWMSVYGGQLLPTSLVDGMRVEYCAIDHLNAGSCQAIRAQ
jgi:hypothetical protein